MSQNYVSFKKYPDAKEARAIQQLLIDNGIECTFIDGGSAIGSAMTGELSKEYELQLHPDNFEQAQTLLEKEAEGMIANLPEDYYLLSFTNEELHDVVVKHYEWSEFDYMLALKLLAERGHGIDQGHINNMRIEELNQLAKPEKSQKGWVAAGYIFAILGGFFGIVTGYVLWTSQKTLPNGDMVYTYNNNDRKNGKNILILSIITTLVYLTIWFWPKN
ncbi:hypothetical protein [Flavobacterium sp. AG291]|uniref:hypothetical protein n=1 Tax=Flavobacterium sp. AG291 TaxID=2184000 RepID=UPI000E0A63AF|nr:hypothetical protein [Flavobacterium sp. AG291]RDI09833.1 putative signal transducing protein [Flavobacterium sp. AG291]